MVMQPRPSADTRGPLTPSLLYRIDPTIPRARRLDPPAVGRAALAACGHQNYRMPDYAGSLREEDLDSDPLRQFAAWFQQAAGAGLVMPEAAALATASADGTPSVRMVLVKAFEERGFVFYTGYDSRKGRELAANPRAALLFHWLPLGRQVRIEGDVERTSAEETAAYVRSRPRDSQLSALASPQSRVIPGRETLEVRVAELRDRYGEAELPLPEGWGGFRLLPLTYEFWQQRENRLHDRLSYTRGPGGGWVVERLAP
jgi:pyridoxamine 5'-phosphate oxidase